MLIPFKKTAEKIAYQNKYFTILDRTYHLPDKTSSHFFVHQEIDTCCVLAQTKEGLFIAIQEYRVGPDIILTELPAGRLEHERDNPDERIQKELLEETGYQGVFKKIAVLPTSPYSTRSIHCYYAVDCEKVSEQKLDSSEFIEVKLLPKDKMYHVLISGKSSSSAPGILAWEWMKKDGVL